MKKIVVGLLIMMSLIACKNKDYIYPQKIELSDEGGAIIDTLSGHLPKEIKFAENIYTQDWDVSRLAQLNTYFLETKEPVLFNFYQGRDVYRLVINDVDKKPIILSVNNEKGKAWIVVKTNIQTEDTLSAVDVVDPIQDSLDNSMLTLDVNFDVFSRELTGEQVLAFDSIFQKTDFFHLPIGEVNKSYSSYYLLEVHQPDKYWYVYRPLDDQTLREVVDYMKSVAKLKD